MRFIKVIFLLIAVLGSVQLKAQEKPNIDEMLVKLLRDEAVTESSPANNAYEVEVTIKDPHLASKFVLMVENVESQQVLITKPVNLVQKSGQIFYTVDGQEYAMKNNKAVVRIEIGALEFDPLTVGYQMYDLQNKEIYK